MQPLDVIPTDQDRENYRCHQAIADKQNTNWQEAYSLPCVSSGRAGSRGWSSA
jgi:hypothetical protein